MNPSPFATFATQIIDGELEHDYAIKSLAIDETQGYVWMTVQHHMTPNSVYACQSTADLADARWFRICAHGQMTPSGIHTVANLTPEDAENVGPFDIL